MSISKGKPAPKNNLTAFRNKLIKMGNCLTACKKARSLLVLQMNSNLRKRNIRGNLRKGQRATQDKCQREEK